MKTLMLTFLINLTALASTSDFKSHFFINGKKVKGMHAVTVNPNAPTLIEMYFTDPKTNEVYKNYKVMHGKYMHMVIANKDLSVFKHVHPYYDPMTGRFVITLNMPYADPDNQDAVLALTRPGMYMIMADVIVAGVGMRMDHAMVAVKGDIESAPLILDGHTNHVITKFFQRDNEQDPAYKAIFSKKTIRGCSGSIVHFEVEMFHLVKGNYEPLLDFQPWLDEAAHAVWLSENYMRHMHHKMPFAHMHSPMIMEETENDGVYDHILRFNFHDQNIMSPGAQKIWIQFKHQNKVMKIPFIFDYRPDIPRNC